MRSSTERLKRMKRRLSFFGLERSIILHPDDYKEEFERFIAGAGDDRTSILNCLFAHILAYRKFLESTDDECLVIEDDCLFHNDFNNKLKDLISRKPKEVKSILLSPYLARQIQYRRKICENMYVLTDGTFSTSCYYTTREFGKYVMDLYDKPLMEYPGCRREGVTSEFIMIDMPGATCCYPPLVIEDCIDSNIDHTNLDNKRTYWGYYGYENYNECDEDIYKLNMEGREEF